MVKPIYIKVGGSGPYDPAAGGTDCVIPGMTNFYLEKTGYGTYPFASYSILTGGGFRLIGDVFEQDETFYVHPIAAALGTATSGSYTNGFNINKVLSSLSGRVGWRQTTVDGEPVLSSPNTTSRSGRFFNDGSFHALVTLRNIKAVQEDASISDTEFNTLLEVIQRSVIMRILNSVFGVPEYISQRDAFARISSTEQFITGSGKFAGVRIAIPPAVNLATQLDSVALYFDSDVTFPLYLFSEVKKAAVWSDDVTAVANTLTQVTLPDLVLTPDMGNVFYLGYFQDDLNTAKAIREQVSFNCGTYSVTGFEAETKPGNDFERSAVPTGYNTYGINPHISVFRDHTMQIVKKASLFDNAIGLGMASWVLEQLLYSKRSNDEKRILADGVSQALAQADLNGVAQITEGPAKIKGLKSMIDSEINRMRESFFPKPKGRVVSLC